MAGQAGGRDRRLKRQEDLLENQEMNEGNGGRRVIITAI